jgi:hypothetical protein
LPQSSACLVLCGPAASPCKIVIRGETRRTTWRARRIYDADYGVKRNEC